MEKAKTEKKEEKREDKGGRKKIIYCYIQILSIFLTRIHSTYKLYIFKQYVLQIITLRCKVGRGVQFPGYKGRRTHNCQGRDASIPQVHLLKRYLIKRRV